jgi:Uma2 family endonuclease
MTTIDEQVFTPDDVLRLEDKGLYELVHGQLIEKPMSELANETAVYISSALFIHVNASKLGRVLAEQNFKCFPHDPDLVRRPDVAFILAGRAGDQRHSGHVLIAPDIAVEVVSPNDLAYELDEKLKDYRLAGIPLTWVVNPEIRTVTIYRADGTLARLFDHETLTGENVLPGFTSKVGDLLPTVAATS